MFPRTLFIEGAFRALPTAMPFHKRQLKQEWATNCDLLRQSLAGNFRFADCTGVDGDKPVFQDLFCNLCGTLSIRFALIS